MKHLFHSFVVPVCMALMALPQTANSGCPSCGGGSKPKLIVSTTPSGHFDPGDMASAPVDSSAMTNATLGPVTAYKMEKGRTYTVTLTASKTDATAEAQILGCSGDKLWYRIHSTDQDARWGNGTAAMTAQAPVTIDPGPEPGCDDPECTKQPRCTCSHCHQESGPDSVVPYHTAYWARQKETVQLTLTEEQYMAGLGFNDMMDNYVGCHPGSERIGLLDAVDVTAEILASGVSHATAEFWKGDDHGGLDLVLNSLDEQELLKHPEQQPDDFLMWDDNSIVERTVSNPGMECQCYQNVKEWRASLGTLHRDGVPMTMDFLSFIEDSSPTADEGNGDASGPSSDGDVMTNEATGGGAAPEAKVPSSFTFGLGRDSSGKAYGLLILDHLLDSTSGITANDVKLMNPFGVKGCSRVTGSLPQNVNSRFVAGGLTVDVQNIAGGVQLLFTKPGAAGASPSPIATHTIVVDSREGLSGVIYTVSRNGITQQHRYYGAVLRSNDGSTGRHWVEIRPGGMMYEGTDTPPDLTNSLAKPWTRQLRVFKEAANHAWILQSTRITSFQRFPMNHGYPLANQPTEDRLMIPGQQDLVTQYAYFVDTDEAGNQATERRGQLKWKINPDGSWERHDYDPGTGAPLYVLRPWLSTVTDPAQAATSNSVCTTYEHTQNNGEFQSETWDVETINDIVTSRTWKRTWEDMDPFMHTTLWTDPSNSAYDRDQWINAVRDVTHSSFASLFGVYHIAIDQDQGTSTDYVRFKPIESSPMADLTSFDGMFKIEVEQKFTSDYFRWDGSVSIYDNTLATPTAGKIVRQGDAVGRLTSYRYEQGTYDSTTKQFTWDGKARAQRRTETHYSYDPATFQLLRQQPIVNEQWSDYQGNTRVEKTCASQKGTRTELSTTVHDYDPLTRERSRSTRDGVQTYSAVTTNRIHDETDEAGITTRTTYDEEGEVVSTAKVGYNGRPNIVSVTQEDAFMSSTTESVPGLVRKSQRNKDGAGRTTSETNEDGLTTTYAYELGGRRVIETLPGGATRITENYLDGRVKSVTGTAVTPEYHEYDVNDAGEITETIYSNDEGQNNARSPRWMKTTTNGLGWLMKEERPGPPGTTSLVTQHFYNTKGQRVRTSRTGQADTLYVYDSFGNLAAQGQDFNGNLQLDLNSADPITSTWKEYTQMNGGWYEVTTTASFLGEAGTDPVISQQILRRLDGGQEVVMTQSSDGTLTTQTTLRNPGSKTTTVVATNNRSTLPMTSVYVNGLLMSQTSATCALPTSYEYDALERLVSVTLPDGQASKTVYDDVTDGSGLRATQRIKLQQSRGSGEQTFVTDVTYTYDPASGRLLTTTNRAGETVHSYYDTQGRLLRQWGTATYPVAYEYNGYGETVKMATYRSPVTFTFGTSDVTGANLTLWDYDAASGALLSKSSPLDPGPGMTSVSYQYGDGGQLIQRTSARGLVTTYAHDVLGRLTDVSYPDSATPPAHFTYYRNGERKTTTDAAGIHFHTPVLMRLRNKTADLNTPAEIVTPANSTDLGSQVTEFRDGQGRRSEWILGIGRAGQDSVTIVDMRHTYQPSTGLPASIALADGSGRWAWTYNADSERIATVEGSASGGPVLKASRSYDNRGRLTGISYARAQTRALGWNYQYDPQHPERRTAAYDSAGLLPGWRYNYNTRGEVVGAQRGTGSTASLTAVAGQDWSYQYDEIGNRQRAAHGNHETVYQANTLNQYTSITRRNSLEVSGLTKPGVLVSVTAGPPSSPTDPMPVGSPPGNGEPGGYAQWLDDLVTNATGQWPQITVRAKVAGSTDPSTMLTTTGRTLVRPTANPVYDADGNLTNDGVFTYEWDTENRLVKAEMLESVAPLEVPLIKVEIVYDAQGRRIRKRVSKRVTPQGDTQRSSDWTQSKLLRFWYDGWNVVAETDGDGNLIRRYVWGTDLSGTPQGAGGVGGLLAVQRFEGNTVKIYHVCTEANGNIMGLVEAANGELVARFDYDPFGNVITDWRIPGFDADDVCPYRFSTKYVDVETGLLYYGYRYYSPETGRWTSTDPIEEAGGLNLYGMCENDALNRWDLLGEIFPGPIGGGYPTPFHPDYTPTFSQGSPFPPGKPGFGESLIPVYGSAWEAEYNFHNGEYAWGAFYTVMAISDVALLRSIATGIGKGCWKVGSHGWTATRAWYGRTRPLEYGQEVHHWLLHQRRGIGKFMPGWLKNQPWNLQPIKSITRNVGGQLQNYSSKTVHLAVHGRSRQLDLKWTEKLWLGTPDWAKNFSINLFMHSTSIFEKIGESTDNTATFTDSNGKTLKIDADTGRIISGSDHSLLEAGTGRNSLP